MVMMGDINVEKKKTSPNIISSFKNVKKSDHKISEVISMSLNNKTLRNTNDWNIIIRRIVREKPKNFPRIKSCLLIGLLKIRKIVFHSISRNNSWLPTNRTPTSQKNSIIAIPKSTITFSSSPMVSFPRARENTKKIHAKNSIM